MHGAHAMYACMHTHIIVHWLQHEYAGAEVEYEAVLKQEPDNTIVKDNMKKLKRAMSKHSTIHN